MGAAKAREASHEATAYRESNIVALSKGELISASRFGGCPVEREEENTHTHTPKKKRGGGKMNVLGSPLNGVEIPVSEIEQNGCKRTAASAAIANCEKKTNEEGARADEGKRDSPADHHTHLCTGREGGQVIISDGAWSS